MNPSNDYLSLINKQLLAYNARDIDAFCNCYHPEIQIFYLIQNKLALSGMDSFKSRYQHLFSKSPNLNCIILSTTILDNSIVMHEKITGSCYQSGEFETFAIFTFRDGLIDRAWFTL